MKIKRMTIFLISVMSTQAFAASQGVNPASLTVKIFEMRASFNRDCSNSVSVFKTASPTSVNMAQLPTLGSGSLPDGTYHCLMFHIDDMITFTPDSTSGLCTAGSTYTADIFSDPTYTSVDPVTGAIIQARANQEDNPWIYFSDSSVTSTSNNCFTPTPTACACSGPCPLSPFLLSSDASHSLVMDFDKDVGDFGTGACTLQQPVMSIR